MVLFEFSALSFQGKKRINVNMKLEWTIQTWCYIKNYKLHCSYNN